MFRDAGNVGLLSNLFSCSWLWTGWSWWVLFRHEKTGSNHEPRADISSFIMQKLSFAFVLPHVDLAPPHWKAVILNYCVCCCFFHLSIFMLVAKNCLCVAFLSFTEWSRQYYHHLAGYLTPHLLLGELCLESSDAVRVDGRKVFVGIVKVSVALSKFWSLFGAGIGSPIRKRCPQKVLKASLIKSSNIKKFLLQT